MGFSSLFDKRPKVLFFFSTIPKVHYIERRLFSKVSSRSIPLLKGWPSLVLSRNVNQGPPKLLIKLRDPKLPATAFRYVLFVLIKVPTAEQLQSFSC